MMDLIEINELKSAFYKSYPQRMNFRMVAPDFSGMEEAQLNITPQMIDQHWDFLMREVGQKLFEKTYG